MYFILKQFLTGGFITTKSLNWLKVLKNFKNTFKSQSDKEHNFYTEMQIWTNVIKLFPTSNMQISNFTF